MTKIKLCGNFRLVDANYLNQARPDLAGIVLAPGHRRSVDRAFAQDFRQRLRDDIPLVGVFINPTADEVLSYQDIIQYAQLHGQESEDLVAAIQAAGMPVIKQMQPDQVAETQAAMRLVDPGAGSGTSFNWQRLEGSATPTILAGGLNLDNLAQAITTAQPDYVDISSGSEVDGVKDLATMQALVQKVREL